MTDKPTTDRKIGALDSCLIVNRVISFLCDRYEDIVGLADQYRTGIAGAMDFILERGLEEAFTARAIMQQAEKEEEYERSEKSRQSAIADFSERDRSEKDSLWEDAQ